MDWTNELNKDNVEQYFNNAKKAGVDKNILKNIETELENSRNKRLFQNTIEGIFEKTLGLQLELSDAATTAAAAAVAT